MHSALVDAMAHLDDPRVDDPDGVLARAAEAGVEVVITAGVDPLNIPERRWSEARVDVRWAYGIHPQAVRVEALAAQLEALAVILDQPAVVAIGELGLDGREGMPPAGAQERALRAQLALARERELPVILHCVRRLARLLEILAEDGPLPAAGMLHGFAGPAELAPAFARLGLSFSFGGMVTRPTSKRCRAAAAAVPAERLLVESDTPDHPPAWCQGPSEPSCIRHTLSALATLRRVGADEMAALTTENARRLFRLPAKTMGGTQV